MHEKSLESYYSRYHQPVTAAELLNKRVEAALPKPPFNKEIGYT